MLSPSTYHPRACVLLLVVAACGDPSPAGSVDASGDADTGTDPLRVQWERLGDDGPTPRPEANVGTLNGKLVLFGGRDGINQFFAETWVWDGAWTQLSPPTSPLGRANGALIEQNGRLVLTGGVGRDENGTIGTRGETWSFDGTTWTLLPGEIPPRQSAAAALVNGHVVVVGGSTSGTARLADAWALAPDATTWSEVAMDPLSRRDAAMTSLGGDGYLTGGSVPGASADVSRFDGTTWTQEGTLPRGGRAYHGAAALAGRVVVFGGVRTSTNEIADTDGWPHGVEVVGDEPAARQAPVMVTLGDVVYMWGGRTADGETSELWRLSRAPD